MQNVHDFKMTESEFGSYLFNFKKSLIINSARNIKVGDFARMFEYVKESGIITGRNLMFEILYVDKTPGLIRTGDVWLIDLKKVETV